MAALDIPLICYDFTDVSRYFRSVATTIALQRNTTLEWNTYYDSSVLNGIYSLLFWKALPGIAEVNTASHRAITEEVDQLHERFVLAWLRKLHEGGPAAANEYVRHMGEVREAARDAIDDVFRDAGRINSEVAGETRDAIIFLSRVRLAATVGVAVIGGAAGIAFAAAAAGGGAAAAGGLTVFGIQAGASGAAFSAAGLGFSVTGSIIKTWEDGPKAQIAAVSMEAGKAAASEVGGTVAQNALDRALTEQARSKQIIASAEGQIKQHSERLARDNLRKGAVAKSRDIVERATRQVAKEADNLARAGAVAKYAGAAAKGIPVVFAAIDIMDAVSDYNQMMDAQQGARQTTP
jgi:hypothetical protein